MTVLLIPTVTHLFLSSVLHLYILTLSKFALVKIYHSNLHFVVATVLNSTVYDVFLIWYQ